MPRVPPDAGLSASPAARSISVAKPGRPLAGVLHDFISLGVLLLFVAYLNRRNPMEL